jgi:hypothetical protein
MRRIEIGIIPILTDLISAQKQVLFSPSGIKTKKKPAKPGRKVHE